MHVIIMQLIRISNLLSSPTDSPLPFLPEKWYSRSLWGDLNQLYLLRVSSESSNSPWQHVSTGAMQVCGVPSLLPWARGFGLRSSIQVTAHLAFPHLIPLAVHEMKVTRSWATFLWANALRPGNSSAAFKIMSEIQITMSSSLQHENLHKIYVTKLKPLLHLSTSAR